MVKSRTLRKAGAVALSAALALSIVGTIPASAAAKKVTLSKTSGSVKVGKTVSTKIKGTKKANIKKVTFKYTKAGVAKATRSGLTIKVKGVKAGKTTVKAIVQLKKKVGTKKKYTLKYVATVKAEATPTVTTVPDDDGNTIIEGKVAISDNDGLQSDGTVLIGDTIQAEVPAELGDIKSIVWYVDNKIVSTSSANGDPSRLITANVGEAYALITTSKGTKYKSDSLTITDKEAPAVIKDFALSDSYTVAANIAYNTIDARAIATVTLNKGYAGRFGVFAKNDTNYGTVIGANPLVAAAPTNNTQITDDNATAGGVSYQNLDGSVTYKWIVGGVTRGSEYVVTFDQTSISTDTPGAGTANVFATAAAAPYLTAPAKIAITAVAAGTQPTIDILDANGAKLSWLTTAAGTANGLAFKVYSNTKSEAKDGTELAQVGGNQGAVTSGTLTFSGAAPVANPNAYWYATVDVTKGIYGADAVTLTSEIKDLAQAAATQITILQNATTPTSADIKFSNLRCSGKVYIIAGTELAAATDVDSTAALLAFDAGNTNTFVTSEVVEKGKDSVTVANAISKLGTAGNVRAYDVVFIPDDTANYGRISTTGTPATLSNTNGTANAAGGSLPTVISQVETSYKLEKTNDAAANGADHTYAVQAYDQFGEKMAGAVQGAKATTPSQAPLAAQTATPTISWAAAANATTPGALTIGAATGAGGEAVGDKYTAKIGATTFTITVVTVNTQYSISAS